MKLVVTDSAWSSLAALIEFWAGSNTDERIAERVDEIWEQVQWLVKNPGAGQFEEHLEEIGLHHRRWVADEIRIIYRVIDDTLFITDFFDSRQDPGRMKR